MFAFFDVCLHLKKVPPPKIPIRQPVNYLRVRFSMTTDNKTCHRIKKFCWQSNPKSPGLLFWVFYFRRTEFSTVPWRGAAWRSCICPTTAAWWARRRPWRSRPSCPEDCPGSARPGAGLSGRTGWAAGRCSDTETHTQMLNVGHTHTGAQLSARISPVWPS